MPIGDYTSDARGFLFPEGLGGVDITDASDARYITAKRRFEEVFINNTFDASKQTSGKKYGEEGFGDVNLVKIYFEGTPEADKSKAVVPFYKANIYPKIKSAVSYYIQQQYDPDGLTPKETSLKAGFERYLAKLGGNDKDILRASRKIGGADLADVSMLLSIDPATLDVPTATKVINLFFSEQFKTSAGDGDGTLAAAEALEIDKINALNLSTGDGDAKEGEGEGFLEGIANTLGNFAAGILGREATIIGLDDLDDEQLDVVRQCVLTSDLVNPRAPIMAGGASLRVDGSWCKQYIDSWAGAHPGGIAYQSRTVPFDGRIIPITTKNGFNPNRLVNMCKISKDNKKFLLDDDRQSPEMYYGLSWVYSDSSGLNETEIFLSTAPDDYKLSEKIDDKVITDGRSKQIKNALRNGFGYAISNVDVSFNGTNPATARNDITVVVTINMDNLKSLDTVCGIAKIDGKPVEVKIYDLVTLPQTQTVETKVSTGNSFLRSEYHPDYSRIRLKIWSNEGYWDAAKVKTAMIYDLCTIDHTLKRSDDAAGKTVLTITYKGYFESAMDLSSMDAFASKEIIKARSKRRKENSDYIVANNCDDKTTKKIITAQTEYDRLEGLHNLKTGMLVRELFKRGMIFGYYFNEEYVDPRVINGSLEPTENFLHAAEWLGKIEIKPNDGGIMGWMSSTANSIADFFGGGQATMGEDGTVDLADQGGGYPYHGFFLGDLMYVAMDCMYEDGSAKHHEWAKNLNLRFLMSSITIPDPGDNYKPRNISPLAIPIDLKFFTSWFHSTYTKKEVVTQPVGTFIKDLLERLVNGVIYSSCFSNTSIDESPAQLRVGFFTDHDANWKPYNEGNFFNPGDPDILMKNNPNHSVKEAKTYCTIYQQIPSKLNKDKKMSEDPYTLTMYYGSNRKDANYLTNVSFKKRNQPGLREARFANNDFGNLDLLANVYDLGFSITSPKAITNVYPGVMFNFILTDWAPSISWEQGDPLGESDPHKLDTRANVLGMGGYFLTKKVTYKLTLNVWNDFSIDVESVFHGNDAGSIIRKSDKTKSVSKERDCSGRYDEIVQQIKVKAEEWDLDTSIKSSAEEAAEEAKKKKEEAKKGEKQKETPPPS